MKQYLGDNPFRYTYQVAPNRLLILEEVSPGKKGHHLSSRKDVEIGDCLVLKEDYPYEWKG